MTQEEILEGNKLIAEFMGGQSKEKCSPWIRGYISEEEINFQEEDYPENPHDGSCWKFSELKYHSSWDWLIPCINKIYQSNEYYKWKDASGQFENEVFINTKFIEVTWSAVVEFIKWYNKHKND